MTERVYRMDKTRVLLQNLLSVMEMGAESEEKVITDCLLQSFGFEVELRGEQIKIIS